jgi:hypothetical protein
MESEDDQPGPNPQGAEVATPGQVATSNPLSGFPVNVSLPTIEVRMVDAAALDDYELWFGFASFCAAAVIAFVVALVQSLADHAKGQLIYIVVAVLFFVLSVLTGLRAKHVREEIRKQAKTYPMHVVDPLHPR